MEFLQDKEPDIKKPIIIAAMQDMGNVGSIVINFINDSLKTKTFRISKPSNPTYVIELRLTLNLLCSGKLIRSFSREELFLRKSI